MAVASLLCFTLCFIPQLWRTYSTRDVRGLSPSLWVLVVLGYATGLMYVIAVRDALLIATYAIGLVCAAGVLAGCWIFWKR